MKFFDLTLSQKPRKFYFVGIGGIGMSGLARILMDLGHTVSGSDRQASDITEILQKAGATIYIGHKAEQVKDVDFVIRTSAVKEDNPEIRRARELGIPVMRRAELLGQLFNRFFGIAIAGTHGKTTTTSMLGHCLIQARFDPTVIVGGRLKSWKTNAYLGKSNLMVTEADEYDRSFLTLLPRVAVLTTLEMDHQDIYRDLDDLKQTFIQFAQQVPFDGLIVYNRDDALLREISKHFYAHKLTFGLQEADYQALDLQLEHGMVSFKVKELGNLRETIYLNLPGKHNVLNALASIAVCRQLGMDFTEIKDALVQFQGVERRFDIVAQINDILIVDDYAHHPTEVKATLQAARSGFQRRVIAVFQPHLFSRTAQFYQDFAEALSMADFTIITDIYPAREKPLPNVNAQLISNLLTNQHSYIPRRQDIPQFLKNFARPGDLVLFIGAGNIFQQAKEWVELLKRQTEHE